MSKEKVIIDGLSLPDRLVDLIEQGRWHRPSDISVLKRITGYIGDTDFDFLQLPNIVCANKLVHINNDPDIAYRFGHVSSLQTGQPVLDPALLDVDLALIVAMNWDDECICLDYRSSKEDPRVVFSDTKESRTVWKTIANNFDEFADNLGL